MTIVSAGPCAKVAKIDQRDHNLKQETLLNIEASVSARESFVSGHITARRVADPEPSS